MTPKIPSLSANAHNFDAELVKCNICNGQGYLLRSLYLQVFPERVNQIPIEAIYVACDCSLDDEEA